MCFSRIYLCSNTQIHKHIRESIYTRLQPFTTTNNSRAHTHSERNELPFNRTAKRNQTRRYSLKVARQKQLQTKNKTQLQLKRVEQSFYSNERAVKLKLTEQHTQKLKFIVI